MIGNDVLFLSVRALGEKIRRRELSPVALTKAYLERLETIGPKLGAVITVTRDLALAQASAAEKEIAAGKYRGPLHDIPTARKEHSPPKGFPPHCGPRPIAIKFSISTPPRSRAT